MATMPPPTGRSHLVSSISQRTVLLLEQETSFAVATVPKEDLGEGLSESPATQLLAYAASALYEVSRSSIITSQEYESAVNIIRGREIWELLAMDYMELLGSEPIDPETLNFRIDAFGQALEGFTERWDPSREGWEDRALLARHGFICQLGQSPSASITQATLFPDQIPFSFLLENVHDGNALQYLADQDLSPEAFSLALEIHDSALRPSYRVRDVVPALYEYQVPFGTSPELRIERLIEILRRAVDTVVVRVKKASGEHTEKMLYEPPISVLFSVQDDLGGIGSSDLPERLEAVVARTRRGQEAVRSFEEDEPV